MSTRFKHKLKHLIKLLASTYPTLYKNHKRVPYLCNSAYQKATKKRKDKKEKEKVTVESWKEQSIRVRRDVQKSIAA